ncbi:MAG: DctP family TRAP transporter solute-binding subunit [Peptococcaceae bacterium]
MQKKVSLVILVAVMLLCIVVTGCGKNAEAPSGSSSGSNDQTPAEVKVLKISNGYAPTHPYNLALKEFKETVESKTNGAIRVDIYDSAVMGTSQDEIEAVMSGTEDAAVVAALSMWQNWSDIAAIEEVPFLFPDAKTARAAFHGDFGQKVIDQVITANNVKALGVWEFGFRHITNNVRPIVEPSDMQGIKFRVGPSQIRLEAFQALGANIMSVAWNELFTALQQKTVDGQENPIMTIESSGFGEVQKYLSLSGHVYNSGFFIINPDYFNSLTPEQQKIVADAAEAGGYRTEELNDELEGQAIEKLKNQGVEVNDTVDKEAFKKAMQPVWEEFREKYGNELLDLALSYVK